MTSRDPLLLLRELNDARRAASAGEPQAEEVLARLDRKRTLPWWRRLLRRRSIVAGVIGVSVASGATVAWAVLHREQATNPAALTCYRDARADSDMLVLSSDGSDPVEQCRAGWTEYRPEWGPAPTLAGCATPDGRIAVVPGDDTACSLLGYAVLDPTLGTDAQQLLTLTNRLADRVLAGGCQTPEEVAAVAAEELDLSGLRGWQVVVNGEFGSTQPCGSLQFNSEAKVIYVLPLPDLFGD